MHVSDDEFARLAADIPDAPSKENRRSPKKWRRNARHWLKEQCQTPLDRNQRAKLMHVAMALEARTRAKGRQNGSVSRIGLMVLRSLLYTFLNGASGRCDPGYAAIMKATGLCKQSVRNALFALERCGLVRIMRRLQTVHVTRENPMTGRWESFLNVVQTTNAYAFDKPVGGAEMLAPPPTPRSEFSKPGLYPLLDILQPGLRHRRKPNH